MTENLPMPQEDNVDFDNDRSGTGTREWSEYSLNIQIGCSHGCLYCFAAKNAERFKLTAKGEWTLERLTKKAELTTYPNRDGVVMFPTTHDITPDNVDVCLRVAKIVLGAGNRLLIVSKPHLGVVVRLCTELIEFRRQIMFRFTIGTTSHFAAAFWEPGAPPPAERIAALRHAFDAGFRTSVSCEPLLGGVDTAIAVVESVRDHVTDTIWVGKLNSARRRVDVCDSARLAAVEKIEALQSDSEIRRLVEALSREPKVRWKDSVKAVVQDAR